MKKWILKHAFAFLCLLFCHSGELHAFGDLNYSIKFCEDDGHKFLLSDVMSNSCQFMPAKSIPISLGYSSSQFWFKVQPDTTDQKVQFLEIRYPLDSIKVYIPTIDGGIEHQTSGERLTFSDRFIKYRNHLFDLSQYDFQNPIYIQIKSDTAIQLPISFWTSRNLLEKISVEQYILGLYFGFILVMFFYNGFLAVSLRDKSYTYYALYLAAYFALQLKMNNLASQYLWPNWNWMNVHAIPIFLGVSFLFLSLFAHTHLKVENGKSKIILFGTIAAFSVAVTIGGIVLPYNTVIAPALLFAMSSSCLFLIYSGYAALAWNGSNSYFFFGWLMFFVGMVLVILKSFGILPVNLITNYSVQVGSAIQMVVFSLGLASQINEYKKNTVDSNIRLVKQKLENENLICFKKTAQQVAHDIRSPIAALTVVTQMLENVPEEQRILIRQAVQRIEDIANDLASTKSKSDSNNESTDSKSTVPQMVSGILDLIVSEKRMQYRSRGGIRIDCNINDKSYGLFANIHENTFKRVFSNLINNAVEALGENGHIEVNLLSADEKNLLIQVRDNGKGIPADIIPKLMQRGETHGKSGGKGLGLYHARATMEEWGGSMVLSSTVGQGTLIEIQLPKVPAPDWFLPELKLGAATRVIVIDDDSSIHQIWTGRFKAPQYKNNEIVHFSSAEAVLNAFDKSPEIFSGDYVVLCDMELRGEDISGLALLRRVKATDHAVLVTSRFEEPHVRSECKELGIKLIPKNLAGFVPIIVEPVGAHCVRPQTQSKHGTMQSSPTVSPDIVLIDDQDMIHTTWKMMAKVKKINLQSFHTAEEFFAKCGTLDKNCRIFIDSNLADGVKGEVIAKDIHARGFENIYLATGSDASDFPPMPWIKKVVGKQPLFGE